MRFLDHLRLNPICFDGETDRCDFDASALIENAVVFDIEEVADQLIERTERTQYGGRTTRFTPKAAQFLKVRPHPTLDRTMRLDDSQYVGIIPPFETCCFEYPCGKYGDSALDCGILLQSMPPEWISTEYPGSGYKHFLIATVLYRLPQFILDSNTKITRETVAWLASDESGMLMDHRIRACVPEGVDRSAPENAPHSTPIMVLLASLMMLNCGMLKRTLIEQPPKTRQQRRYEQRNQSSATPPLVRYYRLSIDLEKT